MKKAIALALAFASFSAVAADTFTQGYTRKDGTYVQPHHSTAPNDTRLDNYSTRGNTNPYTGQAGTRDPYPTAPTPSYTYTPPRQPRTPGF